MFWREDIKANQTINPASSKIPSTLGVWLGTTGCTEKSKAWCEPSTPGTPVSLDCWPASGAPRIKTAPQHPLWPRATANKTPAPRTPEKMLNCFQEVPGEGSGVPSSPAFCPLNSTHARLIAGAGATLLDDGDPPEKDPDDPGATWPAPGCVCESVHLAKSSTVCKACLFTGPSPSSHSRCSHLK